MACPFHEDFCGKLPCWSRNVLRILYPFYVQSRYQASYFCFKSVFMGNVRPKNNRAQKGQNMKIFRHIKSPWSLKPEMIFMRIDNRDETLSTIGIKCYNKYSRWLLPSYKNQVIAELLPPGKARRPIGALFHAIQNASGFPLYLLPGRSS